MYPLNKFLSVELKEVGSSVTATSLQPNGLFGVPPPPALGRLAKRAVLQDIFDRHKGVGCYWASSGSEGCQVKHPQCIGTVPQQGIILALKVNSAGG